MENNIGHRNCFIICPIGENGSPERNNSDWLLDYIKPLLTDLGYNVARSDMINDPGQISNQIVGMLISSELVIADLSGHNPNVFYELAIRHTTRKAVIHIIKKGQEIPFDIKDSRAIFYTFESPADRDALTNSLRKSIASIEENGFVAANPYTRAIDDIENSSKRVKSKKLIVKT